MNDKLDAFTEKLERDWSWRIREIVSHTLLFSNADSHQEMLLAKLGVVLLYSHWEGFIKHSTKQYLLIFSKSDIKTVAPHIQAAFFLKHLQKNQYTNINYKLAVESIKRITLGDITGTKDIKDIVSTKSNLDTSTLKVLLSFLSG